jgi:LemA protein
MLGWIIGGAVVLVAGGITFSYYNRFVTLENRVDNSLSQIDVQLKRRADLIPNLIETVKGFAKHEKEAIQAVSDARKALVSAKDLTNRVQADKQLEGALGRLFAIAENYPNFKSDTNFLELQREWFY